MTTRVDPIFYQHSPDVLFDALLANVSETRLQVTWADRQLGIITLLTTQDRPLYSSLRYRCTIYLRRTEADQTTVVVQANLFGSQGRVGEQTAANHVLAWVGHVAIRLIPDEPR